MSQPASRALAIPSGSGTFAPRTTDPKPQTLNPHPRRAGPLDPQCRIIMAHGLPSSPADCLWHTEPPPPPSDARRPQPTWHELKVSIPQTLGHMQEAGGMLRVSPPTHRKPSNPQLQTLDPKHGRRRPRSTRHELHFSTLLLIPNPQSRILHPEPQTPQQVEPDDDNYRDGVFHLFVYTAGVSPTLSLEPLTTAKGSLILPCSLLV